MTPNRSLLVVVSLLIGSLGSACTSAPSTPPVPTPAEAKTFLDNANQTMQRLGILQSQAGWVAQNFITDDTEGISARINQQ